VVSFTPAGTRLLLAADASGPRVLFNLADRSQVLLPVQQTAFAPDDSFLVRGDRNAGTIEVDGIDGQHRRTLLGPSPGRVTGLAFGADGTSLLVNGSRALLRFATAAEVTPTVMAGGPGLALSPDGRLVATTAGGTPSDVTLLVRRVEDGATVWSVVPAAGRNPRFSQLVFSPDSSLLAMRPVHDRGAQLYRASDGQQVATLPADGGLLALSRDTVATLIATTTATSGASPHALLLSRFDGTERARIAVDGLHSFIEPVALSPDGRRAAIGSGALLDVEHLRVLATLPAPSTQLAFSPTGWLAVANNGRGLALLLPGQDASRRELGDHPGALAFSADGSRLAAGLSDGTVALYCR